MPSAGMDWKTAMGVAGVAIVLAAYIPYILAILAGRMRPHVFSWMIWSAVTITVFFAQAVSGGGAGAWAMGVTGAIVLLVTLLAWMKRSDFVVTRFDLVCLVVAAAALPAWMITSDPLWAVVILAGVDLLGFAPTFRKAYNRPFEDSIAFFTLLAARNLTSLAALASYSLATALFPVTSTAACLSFAGYLALRRAHLRRLEGGQA